MDSLGSSDQSFVPLSRISTDQIAQRQALSPATIPNYLPNAISKMGGRNRVDAIRIATKCRLAVIDLP